MNFDQAVKSAMKTWQEVNQNGRFKLDNMRDCWMGGVSNPELSELPPDILEKWGVVQLMEGGGNVPVRDPVRQPARDPVDTPPPPRPQVAGRWTYTITNAAGGTSQGQFQIAIQGNQLAIVATAASQIQGQDGRMHQYSEQCNFAGTMTGQNIVAECNNASYILDGQQAPMSGLPFRMALQVAADGRSMRGQLANSTGATVAIAAQR